MNLDEAVEEARRVSEKFGKVKERARVVRILNYCLKQIKEKKVDKNKKIEKMLQTIKGLILEE